MRFNVSLNFSYIVNLDIRSLMINPYFQEPNDFQELGELVPNRPLLPQAILMLSLDYTSFFQECTQRFISRISNTV